jgi:C4-dicarboxylate transporter DctM subunit
MVALFLFGIPVAFSMAITSAIYMVFVIDVPLQSLIQRMTGGLDSFPLLAIPFFILAGNLMNTGGITNRLVDFSKVLVGHITGGLGHVVVVVNMIMAGMSGSGVADAAGSGSVLIPAMERAKYTKRFAAAIVGAAGTIGPIIPPSIPFVIYGSMSNTSIGRLLLAGAVPGFLMGFMLMIFVYFISKKRNYPKEKRATFNELKKAFMNGIPPMGMPVIILGGIIAGIMTPTEAAAAGAIYALFLGSVIYRELNLQSILRVIKESVIGTASITIIIAAASPMGWVLAFEQAPMKVVAFFQNVHFSQMMVILILNVALLILGCFLEGIAVMIMAIPVLMPLVIQSGIDPVHFGVLLVINIMIGTITPPVGTIMYVVCALGKVSIQDFTREIWPFLLALLICLGIVSYVPEISLWLPNLLMR